MSDYLIERLKYTEAALSQRLLDKCVGTPATIQWPHRILHEAARVVRAAEDVASGRGMFGVNAETDLKWAMEHLTAALANPPQPSVSVAEAIELLVPMLQHRHDLWVMSKGRDPAKYTSQWSQAIDVLRALKGGA